MDQKGQNLIFSQVWFPSFPLNCIGWYSGTMSKYWFYKKFGIPKGLNQAQNEVFYHFIKFESNVFFKTECNDSLQQRLTSSRSKSYEKKLGGPNLD